MATNADIAKATGVSPAVVSRIVNGDDTLRVGAETRDRVLRVVKEMGYVPNAAARSLRSANAGAIALIVHDITNPVYAEIISGAQQAAAKHGKAVLLGEASPRHTEGSSRIEELISGNGLDGLILQGAGTRVDSALARAAERKVPTVLLQSGSARHATLLRLDDESAGYLATEYLLDRGHTRIGYMGPSETLQFSAGRHAGWRRAMRERNLVPGDELTIDADSSFQQGAAATAALLARGEELSAIVVGNVVTAIGVLSALHDSGYQVPRDISIIGIHDAEIVSYLRPALTVVRMPLRQLGEAAVNLVCTSSRSIVAEHAIDSPALKIVERDTVARYC